MTTILLIIVISNTIILLAILLNASKTFNKISVFTQIDVESAVREEMRAGREEASASARLLREEVGQSQKQTNDMIVKTITALSDIQKTRLDEVIKGMNVVIEKNRCEISSLKDEVKKTQKEVNDSLVTLLNNLGDAQKERLSEVTKSINELIAANKLESNVLREKLEAKFKDIQTSNEQKLEEIVAEVQSSPECALPGLQAHLYLHRLTLLLLPYLLRRWK